MGMNRTYQEGDWAEVFSAFNRILMYTRQMVAWTEENVDNEDPDLVTLERFITDRDNALNDIKELYPGLQNMTMGLSETEENARVGCAGLIADILESESESDDNIRKMTSRLGEKLKEKKKSRDAISAYGAVAYNQMATVGNSFNQAR